MRGASAGRVPGRLHQCASLDVKGWDVLRSRVASVLGTVRGQVQQDAAAPEARRTYAHGTGSQSRIVSPLGDCADRLATEETLKHDFILDLPLPFAQAAALPRRARQGKPRRRQYPRQLGPQAVPHNADPGRGQARPDPQACRPSTHPLRRAVAGDSDSAIRHPRLEGSGGARGTVRADAGSPREGERPDRPIRAGAAARPLIPLHRAFQSGSHAVRRQELGADLPADGCESLTGAACGCSCLTSGFSAPGVRRRRSSGARRRASRRRPGGRCR